MQAAQPYNLGKATENIDRLIDLALGDDIDPLKKHLIRYSIIGQLNMIAGTDAFFRESEFNYSALLAEYIKFRQAQDTSTSKETCFDEFLTQVEGVWKTYILTAHPTPFLSDAATAALTDITEHLSSEASRVNLNSAATADNSAELIEKIRVFSEAIRKPERDKEISTNAESARAVKQSEKFYNGLRIEAKRLIRAAGDNGIDVYEQNGFMKQQYINKMQNLVRVGSWPLGGDADSKPDQTYDQMYKGVRLAIQNMAIKDIYQLALDLSTLHHESVQAEKARRIMRRIMVTAESNSVSADASGTTFSEKLQRFCRTLPENLSTLIMDRYRNIGNHKVSPYENDAEFKKDRNEYRILNGQGNVHFRTEDGVPSADLDYICSQNFGDRALKIEYRQSIEVFKNVFDQVLKIAQESDSSISDVNSFIHKLRTDDSFKSYLETRINTELEKNSPSGFTYAEVLEKAKAIAANGHALPKERKDGIELIAADWDYFYFVDTLKKFEIIAKHPDAVGRVLVAEADPDPNQTMKAFALGLVGRVIANKELDTQSNEISVPTTPLFEYENSIFGTKAEREAGGKGFIRLKQSIIDYVDSMIDNGFTGKQITVMVASSDSWKNMSSAVQDLIIQAFIEAEKELKDASHQTPKGKQTNHIELIAYFGTGSSIARNGNMIHGRVRTVQGQEPALITAEAVAAENERYRYHRLREALMPERAHEQKNLPLERAFNNIGNAECLPNESDYLRQRIVEASAHRIDLYLDKYHSISGWLSYFTSPTSLVSANSLAARPANRVKVEGAEGEISNIKWLQASENARTIGYWLALYHMGVGQQNLYFDMSDFMALMVNDHSVNKTGKFEPEKAKEMADLYLSSHSIQGRINSAATALYNTDFDAAWNYLNTLPAMSVAQPKVKREYRDGDTYIHLFDREFSVKNIARNKNTRKALLSRIQERFDATIEFLKPIEQRLDELEAAGSKKKDIDDTRKEIQEIKNSISILPNAILALAYSEWEAQKSAQSIAEMYRAAGCDVRHNDNLDSITNLRKVIDSISPTRTSELQRDLESNKEARQVLLDPNTKDPEKIYLAEAILKATAEKRSPILMNPEIAASSNVRAAAA